MNNTDIFISGGGVAGLTAAAAWGTAGFRVVIVDPVPPVTASTDSGADLRTTAFLQPSRNFLARAGLWDRLAPHAAPLQVMRIADASVTPPEVRDFDAADFSDAPFGWNLPNWLLRREMVARLAELPNVDFRPGTGFAGMLTRTAGAKVRLSDGSTVTASLVIGADGRTSPVRQACDIDVTTTRYGQKAVTFAVTHDAPHDNISTEIHMKGGPFTLVPLPDLDGKPCSAVVWMTHGPDAVRLAQMPDAAFDRAATDRSAGLYGPLTCVSRRMVWPIISQIAHRISAERTALVAEAAHVMPPIGAQGLNMSLADLACLLDLAEASPTTLGDRAMLDAYHDTRHRDIALRVKGIDALNRASIAGHPVLQSLRVAGMRALYDISPLRQKAMAMGLGTGG